MNKPYITIKDGPYGEFYATRLDIGVEYNGDKPIYCVVGHDENHGFIKNIYGSCVLENVLSNLIGYSGKLAEEIANTKISAWNKENEK